MIPEGEWLNKARSLAVGMRTRVAHRSESRQNMIVANEVDRWWCYCQRCGDGAVIQKDHVVLRDYSTPIDTSVELPKDIVPFIGSEAEHAVLVFLVSKNMDCAYLPELYYSASRRRLMLQCGNAWHGRDLTERSPCKWINYSSQQISGTGAGTSIVVEDLFSKYKTEYALRNTPDIGVVCALGTAPKAALLQAIKNSSRVMYFLDADAAGDSGFESMRRRFRPFLESQVRVRPPEGLDPKDMDCTSIRNLILQEVHHD